MPVIKSAIVIDLGNTNKKVALFRDGVQKEIFQSPELDMGKLNSLLEANPDARHIILSSVVDYPESLVRLLSGNRKLVILSPDTPVPVKNLYRTPDSLGKDRLAAAVGGNAIYPGRDVLVVTAGTCITYDFVNKQGEYPGGSISPGLHMRLKALHTFTGKLPLVTLSSQEELTGTDTQQAILSGVLNGVIAEVGGICEQYRQRYPELKPILSGGDMEYFANRLKIGIFAVPNIVLLGLYKILEYNVSRPE